MSLTLEADRAALLDTDLLERLHLALEPCHLGGLGTVTTNKEERRPEQYDPHARGDRVARAARSFCRPRHLERALRHPLRFLFELGAAVGFVVSFGET